jgi:integrase
MAKLTDIAIRNLKPKLRRYEVPDSGCAGLYVSVQPTGRKSFCVRYRFGSGKRSTRKLTLERGISLAAARKLAADAKLAVAQGKDPAGEKQVAKSRTAGATANTLAHVVTKYYQDPRVKALRTVSHSEAMLRRNVLPVFGSRPVAGIKRSELLSLCDELIVTRGERTADATLKILGAVFNWWQLRDPTEEFRSPIVRGMSAYKAHQHRRSRILNDDEIRALWSAATELGVYGSLLKFLLCTAARRNEAAHMTLDELKGDTWILPAHRSKTGEELERPLSKLALCILDELPRIEGCPFGFTLGARPFNSHSRFKCKLDASLQLSQPWQIHDLRRTARSLLSRAGIASDVAELCLGHTLNGVRGVYDRHRYLEEKRHAFEALAAQIEHIVNPQENVLPMRRQVPALGEHA